MKKRYFPFVLLLLGHLVVACAVESEDAVEHAAATDTTLAGSYFEQAEKYREAAQYDSALVYYEKASVIYETDEDWEGYVQCYNGMGNGARLSGEYDQARTYLIQALEVGHNRLGGRHLVVAISYNNIGLSDLSKGKYDQALDSFNEALSIRQDTLGQQHSLVAISYLNIGEVYRQQGDYDRAMKFFTDALAIQKITLDEQHPEMVLSYNNIGLVYWANGDYDQTLEFFNHALAIQQSISGEQNPDMAQIYNNIGVVLWRKGSYDQALDFFSRALAIRRALLGEQHPDMGDSYNNIAAIYWQRGDYDRALEFLYQGLSIRQINLGKQHPMVANSYHNIGEVYRQQGDYDQAMKFFTDALAIQKITLGEQHPGVAQSYNNIGITYLANGEHDQALKFLHRALAIRRGLLGEQHPDVAQSYNNIAAIHREKGDYDQALGLLNQAMLIERNTVGEHHPNVFRNLNNIGKVHEDRGDYDQALQYYQRALLTNNSTFDRADPIHNPPLDNILSDEQFYFSLKHKARAFAARYVNASQSLHDLVSAHAINQLVSRHINRMRVGFKAEGSKFKLIEETAELANQSIQTAYLLNQLVGETTYLHDAFQFAEQSKAAILRDALNETQAKRFTGIPDSLLEQDRQLRIDLAFYTQQLTQERLKRDQADSAKVSLWQGKTFDLKQRYDALLTRFESEYPDYYNLKYQTETVSVDTLQATLLDANTALVEYVLGQDSLFIFTLTQDALSLTTVARDSLLEQNVEALRAGIGTNRQNENYDTYTQHAYTLYQTLIEPVEGVIGEAEQLIIIPDGVLHEVPFEALLTEDVGGWAKQSYRRLPYLINRYTVSYGYSATLLLEQSEKAARTRPRRDFLAYAPVFFDGVADGSRHYNFYQANRDTTDTTRSSIAALPNTRAEVETIHGLFQKRYGFLERLFGNKARIFLEREATEERVKSTDLGQYRFVHFATHAFAREADPLLSGLLLAEADTTATEEDGILYLGEVYTLSLNAELVVLSACETGQGQLARGEGMIGLTRGFLYAGAERVLMSLHRVEDASTRALMVRFYEGVLAGREQAVALRAAKRAMIEEGSGRPRDWAWFLLVGA